MREIKFRAWCDGTHDGLTFSKPHMDYDVTLSPKGYWCSVEGGWDIQGDYKTVPVMQYTSLKDKNGVEIYEGDICWDDHHEYHGEVVFEYGAFNYDWDNITEPLDEVADSVEVIGNIYENPELLEQPND